MSNPAPEEQDIAAIRDRRFLMAAAPVWRMQRGQAISSHALLIEIDLRRAYCAGAWLSVIVLACAAVEAQTRQVTAEDHASPASKLFADNPDLEWLRKLRNELMHAAAPGTPSRLWKVGGNDIAANQSALEEEATRAVEVMFRTIYNRP